MKQDLSIILIQSNNLREIKAIVNGFCNKESGKGVGFSFRLQSVGNGSYALIFPKVVPFDLFCELLFKLDVLSEDNRKVLAYLNVEQKESGLPAGCMIYVNATEKSDFAAVDANGNLYEDDVKTEPYFFRPTGRREKYVHCRKMNFSGEGDSDIFHVTEEKMGLLKRMYSMAREVTKTVLPSTVGCLPTIIVILIACYTVPLWGYTKGDNVLILLLLIAAAVGIFPIKKTKYIHRALAVFVVLNMLVYIPNYHFPKQMEKRKAVVEKIFIGSGGGRYAVGSYARFRFDDNETFSLSIKRSHKELMHVGDTCVLDMGEGLWGMEVCRGVMCNGKQIWKH